MSSLAASRADNFYFPPEWRPEYGGISKFQGSKGANQYEQRGIVRFELPFDGWCRNCHRHLGKGTRFNAKKEKEGKYFTTTLYSFHMKCPSCDQKFIIKTDPANRTYDYAEGIRKMEQEFDVEAAAREDNSLIVLGDVCAGSGDSAAASGAVPMTMTAAERVAMEAKAHPIQRLQTDNSNRLKVLTVNEQLEALMDMREERYGGTGTGFPPNASSSSGTGDGAKDYGSNARLRQLLRGKKKEQVHALEEGRKRGVNYPLLLPGGEAEESVDRADHAAWMEKREAAGLEGGGVDGGMAAGHDVVLTVSSGASVTHGDAARCTSRPSSKPSSAASSSSSSKRNFDVAERVKMATIQSQSIFSVDGIGSSSNTQSAGRDNNRVTGSKRDADDALLRSSTSKSVTSSVGSQCSAPKRRAVVVTSMADTFNNGKEKSRSSAAPARSQLSRQQHPVSSGLTKQKRMQAAMIKLAKQNIDTSVFSKIP